MLIESGLLSHAWDIRGPGAKRRSEIRVWRTSLVRFVNGIGPGPDSETEDVVLDSLFSHSRPELRSTELQRLLAASQNHIATLIESKCLTGLNPPSPGPNGYVRVTRSSVVEFLRARRIT